MRDNLTIWQTGSV